MDVEEVWIQKPLDLLRRLALLPTDSDDFTRRFNTLTRLLIVICVILAVVKWKYWYVILVAGLLILLHAYMSQIDSCNAETKMKTFTKNKSENVKMSQESAKSFYTVQRIVDTSKGVSLQQIVSAPQQPKVGETIVMKPKVVLPSSKLKKSIPVASYQEPRIKIKGKNGASHPFQKSLPRKDHQPDFMRLAFEELEDGDIANLDSKNLDSLTL